MDLDAHAALTTAHGAVSAATASKMVVRDASARAKFAAPAASGDALIKGTRVTISELPTLTTGKIWKGVAGVAAEADLPSGAIITSGQYTGDSTENRAVAHGLGVTPKFVYINMNGTGGYRGFIVHGVGELQQSASADAYAVTAPDATNFYVGDAAQYARSLNYTGWLYNWVAIG